MDNPATLADLSKRGYDGPASAEVQQTRLDEAWRALQLEPDVRPIVDWIAAGRVPAAAAADVVAAAALRVLRNPEGRTDEAGSIDDYSESWKLADATEDVYFTAAEKRRLTPTSTVPSAGSFKYS